MLGAPSTQKPSMHFTRPVPAPMQSSLRVQAAPIGTCPAMPSTQSEKVANVSRAELKKSQPRYDERMWSAQDRSASSSIDRRPAAMLARNWSASPEDCATQRSKTPKKPAVSQQARVHSQSASRTRQAGCLVASPAPPVASHAPPVASPVPPVPEIPPPPEAPLPPEPLESLPAV